MSNLDKTIAALQSRITRRGQEIADLEGLYGYQRAVAYTSRQYTLARAIREDIAPLAEDQKLDRRVFRQLTEKRTEINRRAKDEDSSGITIIALGDFFDLESNYNLTRSNKFSFPA